MRKALGLVLSLSLAASSLEAQAEITAIMETSAGVIELSLDDAKAPISVANFIEYARSGYYDGLVFHRVIPRFMIQGGGMDAAMKPRQTRAPIKNESDNGLSNVRGTIAMARTRDPDSATSQFFINSVDNLSLDGAAGRPGYTVFGRVTAGLEVVDQISATPTTTQAPFRDVPKTPILINRVTISD